MTVSNDLSREASLSALGTAIAGAAYVASELVEEVVLQTAPAFARDVVNYTCYGGMTVGIVLTIYSIVRLAKKILEQNDGLTKPLSLASLGVVFTAIAQAAQNHLWEIAPEIGYLNGASLGYAVATNFAWFACGVAAVSGSILTIYTVYRIAEYALSDTAVKA